MLMFYKGLDPMLVQMTAYYRRSDRKQLAADRAAVERAIGVGRTGPGDSDPREDKLVC